MIDGLSLDEVIALGKKVNDWKSSRETGGEDCIIHKGSIKDVMVIIEKRLNTLNDPGSHTYRVSVTSENIELARFYYPATESHFHAEQIGNEKIKEFYHSVLLKEKQEKETRRRTALEQAKDLLKDPRDYTSKSPRK